MRRQGGVFWCAGFIAPNRLRDCCHLTAECLKTGNPVVHRSVEPPADAGGCSRCAPQLVVRITRVLFYLRVGEQNGQCISRCTQVKVKVRFCKLLPSPIHPGLGQKRPHIGQLHLDPRSRPKPSVLFWWDPHGPRPRHRSLCCVVTVQACTERVDLGWRHWDQSVSLRF